MATIHQTKRTQRKQVTLRPSEKAEQAGKQPQDRVIKKKVGGKNVTDKSQVLRQDVETWEVGERSPAQGDSACAQKK